MEAVWSQGLSTPAFGRLDEDIKTDVLIIGGGITGVLCAYMLDRAGVDYVLAEAKTIGSGITKNTTAKITSQHGLIYDKLISEFGVEKARMYLEANEAAISKYRELCADIDCDFEDKSSFVYSLSGNSRLEKELAALEVLGYKAKFHERLPLPFSVSGAIGFNNQAQFNPMKFLYGISKNLNIYENTVVRELQGSMAITSGGVISARAIIVATHFPFINKHGGYYIKLYQDRSYAVALKDAGDFDGMYMDEAKGGMSFRNYGNYLIIGDKSHRTGKKSGAWDRLDRFSECFFPDSPIEYRWATQDCMTLDSVPYIGLYSKSTPDFYVATGFNKWGMTSAMVSAALLCDMIQGKKNPYADVFSPSRSVFRAQLAVNALEAVVSLACISKKRCPHLGCALKWNPRERSWDCPCHGSRFTEKGGLIDNPATGDLKK